MNHCFRMLFLVSAALLFVSANAAAQIPNAGFEDWASGEPVDWLTSNIPGVIMSITQTSDAHGGASAVTGVVTEFGGMAFPISMISGTEGGGFPVNSRPEALHGWYKFSGVGPDVFMVTVACAKDTVGIAGGAFATNTSTTGGYQEFVANIVYGSADVPDTAYIVVQLTSPEGFANVGSTFFLDDLFWGSATTDARDGEAPKPSATSLQQNYPNPFNPTTIIPYEIAASSHVVLTVHDALGREVARLVDGDRTPGAYRALLDAARLPAGTYFYRLNTGGTVLSRTLSLVK